MNWSTSTSPLLSARSDRAAGDSPRLGVEETSLPALPRRFFDDAERAAVVAREEPEREVPEVESREVAEVEVPAVMLAEEDEPRLKGLEVGKGTS